MPYERPEDAAARKAARAERARELQKQKRALQLQVEAAHLEKLRSNTCRGIAGVAAVLGGVSERMAFEISRRPDFPKPRVLGDRTRIYLVSEILCWLARQDGATE